MQIRQIVQIVAVAADALEYPFVEIVPVGVVIDDRGIPLVLQRSFQLF